MKQLGRLLLVGCFVVPYFVQAKDIRTNEVITTDAPAWLKQNQIEKVSDHIQMKLEWSTRRVKMYWYDTQAKFDKAHNLGPAAAAITKYEKGVASIHMGPQVNNNNFDEVFGHELVHVIVYQKYRGAIPKWLEEGLANHLSRARKVNYKWLASHPFPKDVRQLAHPFKGSASEISYRYKASQAIIEMLEKKCDLQILINLSVKRKMENYISTYCEIKDLNLTFQEWVKAKAKGAA